MRSITLLSHRRWTTTSASRVPELDSLEPDSGVVKSQEKGAVVVVVVGVEAVISLSIVLVVVVFMAFCVKIVSFLWHAIFVKSKKQTLQFCEKSCSDSC